ncbi:MAG TPA: GspH/FimT family pseudopilin [Candidatus Binatia bacterium]|nr:GspH/FimT family pseudopilin [Candidatus Binatia bacterium]
MAALSERVEAFTEAFINFETNSRNSGGYTLAELLVLMGVIAALLGTGVPAFLSYLPSFRLSSAARQVAADLQLARMRAIAQNVSYTVTFDVSTESYTFGSDSRNLPDLFPGITITAASDATFTSRGTASAVAIELSNGAGQKFVCVKVMGRVNIQDSSCT